MNWLDRQSGGSSVLTSNRNDLIGISFLVSITTLCTYVAIADEESTLLATVFVGLRLSAQGAECQVLQFLVGHTLLTLHSAV